MKVEDVPESARSTDSAGEEHIDSYGAQGSKSRWTERTVLRLIEHARSYPLLFDKAHKDYCKNKFKHQVWAQIAKSMNAEGYRVDQKGCSRKWKYLSDHYKRLRKQSASEGTTEALESHNTWFYFDALSFLDGRCEDRQRISSQRLSETPASPQSDSDQDHEDEAPEPTPSPQPTPALRKKRRREEPELDPTGSIRTTAPKARGEDDCDLVGSIVASTLRRLPEGRIRESAKIRVQELLFKIEFGDE
uniref:MADF domain-containing protein n=1 Tax=Steinernema glaseri TaxID=37863 RepID=A0A1I7ZCU4_9BILA